MRGIKISFFLFLISCFVVAQNRQLLYDFKEIPQSLILNPGTDIPFKGYVGFPLLSGISASVGSSGISVNDIFANDGLDINDKIRERVVFGMSHKDVMSANVQLEIINAGFRSRNNPDLFYSFGLYNDSDLINYWPKDLAILGFEGNAGYLNKRFDFSQIKAKADIVNVFHFGVNKRINPSLVVGGRLKLYSGILNIQSTKNTGYFITTEGQNNLLANTIVADLELRTSGNDEIRKAISSDKSIDDPTLANVFTKRGFFGGDLGFGIDLGFTYNINKQTVFTASLLDLGFISHSNDVKRYSVKGSATVEGVQVILPDALNDPNADFWQNLVDDVKALVPYEDNNTDGYITFRPTKLNASLRYNFGEQNDKIRDCDCTAGASKSGLGYLNSLGGHLFVINRPRGPQAALTAFYQRNFGRILGLKTTYTIDKFSYANIGFGVNLNLGPVNLYLMADNLLGYQNVAASHYASFQFGINIISWGKN